MKKIIRGIFLFVLVLVFVLPLNINALTKQTLDVSIKNTQNLEIGDLTFTNISFKDYSSTSTKAFGLTGIVSNSSSDTISYTSTVYYYDLNHNLIAKGYNSNMAISGNNNFNQMSNLNILKEYSVNDIYYYSLLIEINDSSESNESLILTPSKNSLYASRDYVIDKYDINIIVNENNTFDITETITAYFNVSKHGIFRTIPLKNTIVRLDGTKSTNRTQVSNISVDNEYKKIRENGNYKLQIGSKDHTLIGEQKYVIKYTYNLGKDPMNNYDELYYNIIGNEWDTVIGNITFSITMPKEFDSSKLGFSSGTKGSIDNSKVIYNVNGNKISGSYNGILDVGEALTVRCELPEGYFVDAKLDINKIDYLMFFVPIIFLVISILLWYIFGRDDQIIETIEFYPPEGLNSLDVGFLYKGKAENKDVTSLLIYLANKGYLEISNKKIELNADKINLNQESINNANKKIMILQNKINDLKVSNPSSQKIKYYENMLDIYKNIDTPINYEQYGLKSSINNINKKNKFLIRKLKDYDGTNLHEQWFMEGLFEYNRKEVTDSMLYNNFYITNNRILHTINNEQNKNKVFEKSSLNKKIFIILMIIASYCLITIPPIFTYGEQEILIFALAFPAIGFTALLGMLFGDIPISVKIFGVFWGLGFGGIPWLITVLPSLMQDMSYLICYIIGLLCISGMILVIKYLPKRTKYGNEMLGKLKGFKNFLETVEKEKLESLVMDNPNYFYDILPYTYVLGVSDKWIKKFESISLQAPSWYDSSNSFDISSFNRFINSTMTSAQGAMTSSPSSSSGGSSSGGSSGGGSSGGGSGGGGGGSW